MSDFVGPPNPATITHHGNDDKNGGGSAGASLGGGRGGSETSSGGSMAARTPGGRPPGSKNKPKLPVKERKSAMYPAVLELSNGSDVASGVSDFSRRCHVRISVFGAAAESPNVTLRHPSVHGLASISVSGRFDIFSISGTFFPEPPTSGGCTMRLPPLIVALARPDG
ncbi:hypothetical protein OPV22_005803 [Ensete ventricosum]|uniref:PPC domain-containing protein n=1 Tax=Ensete ventricosum TaxID=4639 RepID=A0AAV8RJZ2_ENSVE|nr:hypothetical protein OPV22_005803 [Ensete ventricosum]